MKKVRCFEAVESISFPGKMLIQPVHDNFHLKYTDGSFNVVCARLFGLSYAEYLRMCRDVFEAEISGKNSYYPIALFKKGERMTEFLKLLNSRANAVLWEREHPDFEEHSEYVKDVNPIFYEEVTANVANV